MTFNSARARTVTQSLPRGTFSGSNLTLGTVLADGECWVNGKVAIKD
jgi:hypothetical protein